MLDCIPDDHGMFFTEKVFIFFEGDQLHDQNEDIPKIGMDTIVVRFSLISEFYVSSTVVDCGLNRPLSIAFRQR